jgi:hypothetical protein
MKVILGVFAIAGVLIAVWAILWVLASRPKG